MRMDCVLPVNDGPSDTDRTPVPAYERATGRPRADDVRFASAPDTSLNKNACVAATLFVHELSKNSV